jgi:hypothetical protein
MLTRLRQNPEDSEKIAAYQVMMLAEQLQDLCYYCRDADRTLPRETEKALHRTYRVLKTFTIWFRGEGEHSLVYSPPDGRFTKGKQ